MRRACLAIAFALVLGVGAMAQLPRINANDNGVTIEMARITGTGTSPWFRVEQYGIVQHTLVVTASGGVPASLSANLECSRDGSSLERVLGNVSNSNGGVIQVTGVSCPYIRANITSSDAQAVVPVYIGAVPTSVMGPSAISVSSSVPITTYPGPGLPLPLCNPVRQFNCQPKGW